MRPDRRQRSTRRLLVGAALAAVVFAGVWAGGCLLIERQVGAVTAQMRDRGLLVELGDSAWRGWPFAPAVEWASVRARTAPGVFPPDLDWRAERVRVRWAAWHPTAATASVLGRQVVSAAGTEPMTVTAGQFDAAIDLSGRSAATVVATDLEVAGAGATVAARRAVLTADGPNWRLQAANASVPGTRQPIALLSARLAIAPPFADTLDPLQAAQQWRNAGGVATVAVAVEGFGPLQAQIASKVSLDETLQPSGDGSIAATNLPAFVSALQAEHTITDGQAVAIRAVVTVLAGPSPGAVLQAPVTLGHGTLFVAGYPVLRLAPLRWQ